MPLKGGASGRHSDAYKSNEVTGHGCHCRMRNSRNAPRVDAHPFPLSDPRVITMLCGTGFAIFLPVGLQNSSKRCDFRGNEIQMRTHAVAYGDEVLAERVAPFPHGSIELISGAVVSRIGRNVDAGLAEKLTMFRLDSVCSIFQGFRLLLEWACVSIGQNAA